MASLKDLKEEIDRIRNDKAKLWSDLNDLKSDMKVANLILERFDKFEEKIEDFGRAFITLQNLVSENSRKWKLFVTIAAFAITILVNLGFKLLFG